MTGLSVRLKKNHTCKRSCSFLTSVGCAEIVCLNSRTRKHISSIATCIGHCSISRLAHTRKRFLTYGNLYSAGKGLHIIKTF